MIKFKDLALAKSANIQKEHSKNYGLDFEQEAYFEIMYKNLVSEIQSVKSLLKNTHAQYSCIPELDDFANTLRKNKIVDCFIRAFVSHLEHTHTFHNLSKKEFIQTEYGEFLKSKIIEYQKPKSRSKQRRIVLLGPTGVGKTTTIFKIVKYFLKKKLEVNASATNTKEKIKKFNNKVNVINFDYHKLGTQEICESISEIMEIKSHTFVKFTDFVSHIEHSNQYEIVLVDTPGKNPKNKGEILEMAQYLNSLSMEIEPFLVLPANLSESDAEVVISEFKTFKYRAIIITKIDETVYPNHLVSLCVHHSLPIIFLSKDRGYTDSIIETDQESLIKKLSEF